DRGVGELQQDRPAAAGEQHAFGSEISEWHGSILRRESRLTA
ncbi:MAG: hypothetical protein JWO18_1028, partial [Microbacteriaceae bacterium]|nr:hypothetical protein [Microbacteriaceae bacterium]